MEKIIADTHAIVWFFDDNPKLSDAAGRALSGMEDGTKIVGISIMTLFEMDYLAARKRINPDLPGFLVKLASKSSSAFKIIDIDHAVYKSFLTIPHASIPELPDRIITATALSLKCPLVSKDSVIGKYKKIEVIW